MGTLYGETGSLAQAMIDRLTNIYDMRISYDLFYEEELISNLADATAAIQKEIAVYVDRRGYIMAVSVGTDKTVPLPKPDGRKSLTRTNGIRCIHTHPAGDCTLSQVDLNNLHVMNFDAIAAVSVRQAKPYRVQVAVPSELYLSFDVAQDESIKSIQNVGKSRVYGPYRTDDPAVHQLMEVVRENDRLLKKDTFETAKNDDRAILVAVERPDAKRVNGKSEAVLSLDELEELTYTAGGTVLGRFIQKRARIDPAYVIGKGKLTEISTLRQSKGANLIIFDQELTGTQLRNIQDMTGAKVLDRTNLILDIFASRAKSREGKLQVELAQLRYTMPQLLGLGQALSRQGGGIGTRGPGETMLETDRRHVLRRITALEKQLQTVKKQRDVMRNASKNEFPTFALVGYTNAGKSTLLNKICKADVFTEDKLFATLDPTVRHFALPYQGRTIKALMTDTVGFIRNLPHHLIEAFKSTLEQAAYADVIVHVLDGSNETAQEHIAVVEQILASLGAATVPRILAVNKSDHPNTKLDTLQLSDQHPWVAVSAVTGEGIDALMQQMALAIKEPTSTFQLFLSYKQAGFASFIHEHALRVEEEYTAEGIVIDLEATDRTMQRIKAGYARLSSS